MILSTQYRQGREPGARSWRAQFLNETEKWPTRQFDNTIKARKLVLTPRAPFQFLTFFSLLQLPSD